MILLTYNPALDLNPSPSGLTISTPVQNVKFQPLVPVSLEDEVWEKLQVEKPYQDRLETGSLTVEIIPPPKSKK